MTPNDEHAWFREQLDNEALAQWREECYRNQALAEIGAEYAIETDAAFIADWTAWAEGQKQRPLTMNELIAKYGIRGSFINVQPERTATGLNWYIDIPKGNE